MNKGEVENEHLAINQIIQMLEISRFHLHLHLISSTLHLVKKPLLEAVLSWINDNLVQCKRTVRAYLFESISMKNLLYWNFFCLVSILFPCIENLYLKANILNTMGASISNSNTTLRKNHFLAFKILEIRASRLLNSIWIQHLYNFKIFIHEFSQFH